MAKRNTSDPDFPHGTATGYIYGCRCDACRAAHAQSLRKWRAAHPEKVAEAMRKWRTAHPDYDRNRYAAYREERREYTRRYYAAHREEARASKAKWNAEHPEELRALWRRRRAREYAAPGRHTAADVRAQYERQKGRCYWCGKRVGRDYHVDHVIPLALGGSNGPENLVIACARCNVAKGSRHPMDFAGTML